MRLRSLYCLTLAVAALSAAACEDSTGFIFDPNLVTDTFEVYAATPANADRPTAVDITVTAGLLIGPRRPEVASSAGQWDFLVRLRDGGIALVPPGALGVDSRSALTGPQSGTFESLREAPTGAQLVSDSARVLETGAVYVARSRVFGPSLTCFQYGKLQPLEIDLEAGRVKLRVTTNQNCGDPRLVKKD